MRAKPIKKKNYQKTVTDTYRGYTLECFNGHWTVLNTLTGTELWDGGYSSREQAVREIDKLFEAYVRTMIRPIKFEIDCVHLNKFSVD